MSILAFVLITLSATLHVSWNTIAKKSRMSVPLYTLICTVSCILWLHVPFWTPVNLLELSPRFYLLALASTMFDTLLYCQGLSLTYRSMDMSTAYPIMRALPILITAGVTSLFNIGSEMKLMAKAGMFIVFLGCLHMPLSSYRDISIKSYFNKGMFFVLMAALGTTGYTVMDSLTMHTLNGEVQGVSNTVVSITFYSVREVILITLLWILTLSTGNNRAELKNIISRRDWSFVLAGICASATYLLVLCAMMHVSNVSFVQVFRQMGLPIGMLAGIFILKEKCAKIRFTGCALIVIGLIMTVLRFEDIQRFLFFLLKWAFPACADA